MKPFAAAACAALLVTLTPGARPEEAPKRLSDWLLEQPQAADAYPLGLSWRVPEEVAAQSLLKRDLLQALASVGTEASGRIAEWVRELPVTGRVPVAVADARWLQANPARDPVLQPNHRVVLPSRPQGVTVITDRGARCAALHTPGRAARDYIEACDNAPADWAWIAQPDGRVQRYGIALWNREPQDEPAPGAWIWAPGRASDWPDKASELLLRFLSTQGPATDEKNRGQTPISGNRGLTPIFLPFRVTASDWGEVGLLQTPTARMGRTGSFRFNFSRVQPYSRGNVFVQPFDWLEAGFRYSDIANRPYGAPEFSGNQSLKDKGFDAKFRLWSESYWLPEVAVGLRDLAGTGLFSGEYVVANKRWRDLDFSLGLGWGYLGSHADIRGFGNRKIDAGQGGSFAFGSYFRGPAAFLGGVQYQSPWAPLIVKLEYDGNDYQHEPQANNQLQRTRWNLGLVYRAASWVDLSLAVERGSTLMFGVAFHTDLDQMQMPKLTDPPRVPVAAARPQRAPDWSTTGAELARQTDWQVERISRRGRELRIEVADAEASHWRERVDRAAAVLHRDAPADVDRFTLAYRQRGKDMAEHVIDREAWVAERVQPLPPGERRETVIAREPRDGESEGAPLFERRPPAFETRLGMDFQYTLGGPDAFALYQFSAAGHAKYRLRNDTWVSAKLRLGLLNNYDKFKFAGGGTELPRVRTFLREYLTTSALTLPNLQVTHVGKAAANHYYSAYGGYLEEMFGGVGAEWLYRPFASRLAFGIDLNAVKQRDFKQDFGFRDYSVATGHATWYWDTGWHDVLARISAGRYLAKDVGVTVDFSRTFRNGVAIGAFMTKTNISAAQFGEGSFDKGVYLSIPFDVMLTKSSSSVGHFVWKPLTRDGGAKLGRSEQLYNITRPRDERTLWTEPAPKPNDQMLPSDRREPWSFTPTGPAPYVQVPARAPAAAWPKDARFEHALVQALYAQQFRNIDAMYNSRRLNVSLSQPEVRSASFAIGRAARTALRLAPLEAREIRLTLYERAEPAVSYDFIDLRRLDQFLRGDIGPKELQDSVAVEWHNPALREADPIARLRDLETIDATPKVADLLPDSRPAWRVVEDIGRAGQVAAGADWLYAGAIGAGAVLGSALLDKRAFRFATDHMDSRWLKAGTNVGNALPWIGMGAAALAALDGSDPRRSRIGYAAAEAGAMAFVAATGLKYAVGRARPDANWGQSNFQAFSTDDRRQSFPSRHAAVAWAVATPFAREYKADWLYGAAAITTLARVGSREHWVSDAVAGSLLGYAAGRIFHEASGAHGKGAPRVLLERNGIKLGWALE